MDNYLVPICSSIWSTPGSAVLNCDAHTILSFLKNHHMLQLFNRPQWLTVKGRSTTYVQAACAAIQALGGELRANTRVQAVHRGGPGSKAGVVVGGATTHYDSVVLACHAPDALMLLGAGATAEESSVLGAFSYVTSQVFLHRDQQLMPRRKAAWSAWNFLSAGEQSGVSLTYYLNRLQTLGEVPFKAQPEQSPPPPVLVTLNPGVPPAHVVAQWSAAHPVPSRAAAAAKTKLVGLFDSNGSGLYFAGAYAGYGFHEDGVKAGLVAAAAVLGTAPSLRPNAPSLRPLSPSERLARLSCASFLSSFVALGQLTLCESAAAPTRFGDPSPPAPPAAAHSHPFGHTDHPASLRVTITVLDPAFYWKLATRADLGLADAYVDGDIAVEPSLMALLCLCIANRDALAEREAAAAAAAASAVRQRGALRHAVVESARAALRRYGGVLTAAAGLTVAHWRHLQRRNTVQQARRNISAHYDLSNDLFRGFLSPDMTYSCAVFAHPQEALQCAQERKLRMLADKARLQPGQHVLEIGFGWGSLTLLLVKHYGCRVTGITLSEQQLALAQARVDQAGVSHLVAFHLVDYRVHVPPPGTSYDRVISCEMLEAVGHEYLPDYFHHVARLMAPSGIAVIQVITTPEGRYDAYRSSSDFIKEYIFPGCCCPSLTAVSAAAGQSNLTLDAVEDIGVHYAPTLLRWRQAFMADAGRVRAQARLTCSASASASASASSPLLSESFVRCWDWYFQYCAAGFATRTLGDVQLVFSRPGNVQALSNVPFAEEPQGEQPQLWW